MEEEVGDAEFEGILLPSEIEADAVPHNRLDLNILPAFHTVWLHCLQELNRPRNAISELREGLLGVFHKEVLYPANAHGLEFGAVAGGLDLEGERPHIGSEAQVIECEAADHGMSLSLCEKLLEGPEVPDEDRNGHLVERERRHCEVID